MGKLNVAKLANFMEIDVRAIYIVYYVYATMNIVARWPCNLTSRLLFISALHLFPSSSIHLSRSLSLSLSLSVSLSLPHHLRPFYIPISDPLTVPFVMQFFKFFGGISDEV